MDNQATSDSYTPATTETFQLLQNTVSLTVLDAAVYVQFAIATTDDARPSSVSYESRERRLVPAHWVFDRNDFNGYRCAGFRVRSYVAGTVAHVTSV